MSDQEKPETIVVVDDDRDIRGLISAQLRQERYQVLEAGNLAELFDLLADRGDGRAERRVDLVVLDLNLPDGDGLSACRELRAGGVALPIIMVTARSSAVDRVLGLELGADDYLTKPFEPRELLARVRNLLRRTRPASWVRGAGARFARFGPWRLDLFQRRLIAPDDSLVMLSSSEFRLLERFIAHPNGVVSREELAPERKATVAYDRSIDLQISRLRQKLAAAKGGEDLIITVRNEGYVLASPVDYE